MTELPPGGSVIFFLYLRKKARAFILYDSKGFRQHSDRKREEGMKTIRRLLALLLCLCALLMSAPPAAAAGPTPFSLPVRVDGAGDARVRAYEDSYAGNLYLSLSDLSRALKGTAKQFLFSYTSKDDSFSVTTGRPAAAADGTSAVRERGGVVYLELTRSRIFVDGGERRYYTYRRDSDKDIYMSLTDVQLMLDLTAERPDAGSVTLFPDRPFRPDPKQLESEGYFDAIGAVILGDADTGEILFSRDSRRHLPIASLSKLMSYLLLCEAAERGEISFSDDVTITTEAERISNSADGMISMSAGSSVPMQELIDAMLIASSNESAAALASHTAGSTEAFVERMNARAAELKLLTAKFYTPHGLPVYTENAVTAKLQNKMCALDMFRLCAYLLEHYPQITAVTARQYSSMKTLKYSTANTNTLVFNLSGVSGLKTGSTDRAGYCVAVSLPVTRGGETHDLVLVLLGAETAQLRGQASEILLRWAREYYAEHEFRS